MKVYLSKNTHDKDMVEVWTKIAKQAYLAAVMHVDNFVGDEELFQRVDSGHLVVADLTLSKEEE